MTPEELTALAEAERAEHAKLQREVTVCMAAGCMSQQSEEIKDALAKKVKDAGHGKQDTHVKCVGCRGLCAAGPIITVAAEATGRTVYTHTKLDHVDEIVSHLDRPVEADVPQVDDHAPFFARQEKVVLENAGQIDPERIEDYIAAGGYQGLMKALTEMTPEQVIAEVTTSKLRGRGGAGFPTGLKWSTVAKAGSDVKYVVCNADEGDPGAFMDRALLGSDPHKILEGMAIAGYACGAKEGFIYIRAEYPLEIKRLRNAIKQATRQGLLGSKIAGTAFSFEINIRLGAGAFVCGEETALIASIEGHRGQPRPRPPFPAEVGLWGRPTLINNVETYANIAPIVRKGGAWYASIGTERSAGTKVFALAGKINNIGLIEVPMGISLREVIYEIGGGIPDSMAFKAVQTGGPSGGCIPEDQLDMSVEYDTLREAGSIMGSGGMIVMDETSSMVDVARYFMEFCMSESCGKCVPCRVGTWQMHEILEKIIAGDGTADDLAMLEELCDTVRDTSLCGLGQTAPNPVISTLRYFRHEYEALLKPTPAEQEVHA